MQFDFFNGSRLQAKDLTRFLRRLEPYRQHLLEVVEKGGYDFAESSINLPSDAALLDQVETLAKKLTSPQLKYVIVVGIGGSNLGTKAIYDALFGYFDILEPKRWPKMIFADTVDPELVEKIGILLETEITSPEEIIMPVISKSGGTTETVANADYLMQHFLDRFPQGAERVVAITDEHSRLWERAGKNGYSRLAIPKTVGGRYSVLSAVGLFPLAAIGIDIRAFRRGAAEMRKQCTVIEEKDNPALQSASIIFYHYKAGKTINDTFFFHPELESIGKWYRQLMGESVGKEFDIRGKRVFRGITPTVSIGSTDLHSVGQLYLGGPKDKYTIFVSALGTSASTPVGGQLSGLVDAIEGKPFVSIMQAILAGVRTAYQKQELPFTEITLENISPASLGAYLQFKMIEMMYLGQLLQVNPFDQPNVELYKIETRKILTKTKS